MLVGFFKLFVLINDGVNVFEFEFVVLVFLESRWVWLLVVWRGIGCVMVDVIEFCDWVWMWEGGEVIFENGECDEGISVDFGLFGLLFGLFEFVEGEVFFVNGLLWIDMVMLWRY